MTSRSRQTASFTTNSLTLDAWVKPDTLSGHHVILSKYDSLDVATQGQSWTLLMLDGGRLRFVVSQDAGGTIGCAIDTDAPVLTAGTWNTSPPRLTWPPRRSASM